MYNIIVAILIFILGFVFHWVGQLISILNWDFAQKIGLQEKGGPKEYKVFDHSIAAADVCTAWIHGIIAICIILGYNWAYRLALVPGAIFIYHSISYWFWTSNQKKDGHNLVSNKFKIIWFLSNFSTGVLAIILALK